LQDQLPARALVLDFEHVMYLDSTGADALLALARTCQAQGVRLIASALATQPLDMARRCGLLP
jgi:SulP family sulfate permease